MADYKEEFIRESTIYLTMASEAQIDLFRIWTETRHCSQQQVLVIAFDRRAATFACSMNIPYVYEDEYAIGNGQDMTFMSEEFLKIGYVKFKVVQSVLDASYNVMFSELDIFELDDSICRPGSARIDYSCVHGESGNFDLEIQAEHMYEATTELNIGVFFLRSSEVSKSIIAEIVECLANQCGWDQKVFTKLFWDKNCCVRNDNEGSRIRNVTCSGDYDCPRMRIWNSHYFAAFGGKTVPSDFTDFGLCPTLVHCNGMTGLENKLECMSNVTRQFGECLAGYSRSE